MTSKAEIAGNAIDEAPPSYDDALQAGAHELAPRMDSKHPLNDTKNAPVTVDAPFNFPSLSAALLADVTFDIAPRSPSPKLMETKDHLLPEVPPTPSTRGHRKTTKTPAPPPRAILAIPQLTPNPTSAFLPSYNTTYLLRHGIPPHTFSSFLTTLSSYLTSSTSTRALAYLTDVGRSLHSIPTKLSHDTVEHVRDVSRTIGESAKRGDFVGAGMNVLAGSVSIPFTAALRAVNATVHQLSIAVGDGLARRPLSARERADAFVDVTQREWFSARGLMARLCDTEELVRLMMGLQHGRSGGNTDGSYEETVEHLVDLMHSTWDEGAEGQLHALEGEFGFVPLVIEDGQGPLHIEAETLWLVLTDAPSAV